MLHHFPVLASSVVATHYLERLVRRGRDGRTLYNYANAVSRFLQWCDENQLRMETVEPWQLEEYFEELPLAASTKVNHLTQIRALYKYGQRRGLLGIDPTWDVELPKPPPKRPKILSVDELRRIKNNAYDDRQYTLFHLLAYTGARRNEVREMVWQNVDTAGNTIYVVGKGGKERLIPIHPVLGELLAEQHPGRPRSDHALVPGPYGRALSMSGLEKLLDGFATTSRFHDFRRTVASSLDANGVQEGEIMKIMGWAPKTVFDKHYRHIAEERLQRAILRLYADCPL